MPDAYLIGICILLVAAFLFSPLLATPYIPLPFTSGVMPTESMVPVINVGDLILVDRTVGFSDAAVGDVVMFRGHEVQPISHRVIAHDGLEMITKGDANTVQDTIPITQDSYLGVVVMVIPTSMFGPVGFAIGMVLTVSLLSLIGAVIMFVFTVRHRRQISV